MEDTEQNSGQDRIPFFPYVARPVNPGNERPLLAGVDGDGVQTLFDPDDGKQTIVDAVPSEIGEVGEESHTNGTAVSANGATPILPGEDFSLLKPDSDESGTNVPESNGSNTGVHSHGGVVGFKVVSADTPDNTNTETVLKLDDAGDVVEEKAGSDAEPAAAAGGEITDESEPDISGFKTRTPLSASYTLAEDDTDNSGVADVEGTPEVEVLSEVAPIISNAAAVEELTTPIEGDADATSGEDSSESTTPEVIEVIAADGDPEMITVVEEDNTTAGETLEQASTPDNPETDPEGGDVPVVAEVKETPEVLEPSSTEELIPVCADALYDMIFVGKIGTEIIMQVQDGKGNMVEKRIYIPTSAQIREMEALAVPAGHALLAFEDNARLSDRFRVIKDSETKEPLLQARVEALIAFMRNYVLVMDDYKDAALKLSWLESRDDTRQTLEEAQQLFGPLYAQNFGATSEQSDDGDDERLTAVMEQENPLEVVMKMFANANKDNVDIQAFVDTEIELREVEEEHDSIDRATATGRTLRKNLRARIAELEKIIESPESVNAKQALRQYTIGLESRMRRLAKVYRNLVPASMVEEQAA
jgi:hypothetical protein